MTIWMMSIPVESGMEQPPKRKRKGKNTGEENLIAHTEYTL